MIIERNGTNILQPRSGGIIMPCLRHFKPSFVRIRYNPFMPSALKPVYFQIFNRIDSKFCFKTNLNRQS